VFIGATVSIKILLKICEKQRPPDVPVYLRLNLRRGGKRKGWENLQEMNAEIEMSRMNAIQLERKESRLRNIPARHYLY